MRDSSFTAKAPRTPRNAKEIGCGSAAPCGSGDGPMRVKEAVMTRPRQVWLRLLAFFRKNTLEAEMDEELHFHFEKQIEDNIKGGMQPEEARYAALRSFGGVEQV